MKKIIKLCVCGLAAATLLAGCSSAEGGATPSDAVSEGTVTKLGNYKGIEVTVQPVVVTDEDVEASIQNALDSNPEIVDITDRAAQDGDILNIDFVGKKDGVEFEGGAAQGQSLTLGSNSFIEGFEEGLVGAKVGDKLSLDLTFPEDYQQPDLAGAAVVFDVTVNGIQEQKEAVLDDAFVERISFSEYKTVDEFRKGIKDDMIKSQEEQIEAQKQYDVIAAIVEGSEIEPSEAAVEAQYQQQLDYYNNMVSSYGMTIEDYISLFDMDMETFQSQIREAAQDGVKQRLAIRAIAKKEKIKVKDADREALALQYDTDAKTLISQYGQEAVDENALMNKVLVFVSKEAKEVAPEETEAVTETVTIEAETTEAETTEAGTTEAGTIKAETIEAAETKTAN